jgi:hypothetical protein
MVCSRPVAELGGAQAARLTAGLLTRCSRLPMWEATAIRSSCKVVELYRVPSVVAAVFSGCAHLLCAGLQRHSNMLTGDCGLSPGNSGGTWPLAGCVALYLELRCALAGLGLRATLQRRVFCKGNGFNGAPVGWQETVHPCAGGCRES